MAINLGTGAPATAACNAIRVMVDSAGVGTGFLQLLNAGGTVGVQIGFSAGVSAFGAAALSASSGNCSCAVPISATCAIAACTIASFRVCQANTAIIWAGNCTTGTGDLVFSNLAALTGDTIVITALNFIVGGTATV